MQARIGHIGGLAKGGHHCLLLIVHGVEAAACRNHYRQHHHSGDDHIADLFPIHRLWSLGRGIGSPAVGSVVFHITFLLRFHIAA